MGSADPTPVLLLAPGDLKGFAGVPGWSVHRGFAVDGEPWDLGAARVLCVGVVGDGAEAAAALSVAARGAALAVEVAARGAVRHRFLEDLHKVTEPTAYAPGPDPAIARLDGLQRQLLEALARGATVTAAAEAANVSRRTANRVLADARVVLEVETNAGAVRQWAAARPSRDTGP